MADPLLSAFRDGLEMVQALQLPVVKLNSSKAGVRPFVLQTDYRAILLAVYGRCSVSFERPFFLVTKRHPTKLPRVTASSSSSIKSRDHFSLNPGTMPQPHAPSKRAWGNWGNWGSLGDQQGPREGGGTKNEEKQEEAVM